MTTPDTFDDPDTVATFNGQISPGCPTAGAVLDRHSKWHQLQTPPPTLSHRTLFAPILTPTRTRNSWTELHPGSFILFQLDNQELARQFPIHEDSESFKRCLSFPTKRYAGLVLGSFGGGSDSGGQEYIIAFVSKSLPPTPESGPEADPFVVPIAPIKQENINGRQPLHPRPFPWTGCYQYTVLGTRIAPTRIVPSAIVYGLHEEDFYAFDRFAIDDRRALNNQWPGTPPIPDEEASLFEKMIISDNTTLPVRVWQDLRAEEECSDPREFVEEVSDFRELALSGLEELGFE